MEQVIRRREFFAMLRVACVLTVAHAVAAAQTCRADQLSAVQDPVEADQVEGGAGHHALVIEIRNRSFPACVLQGAPKVDFLYPNGNSAQVKICANCEDYLFRPQSTAQIMLRPDESVWVVLGYSINDGAGACTIQGHPLTLALRVHDGETPLELKVDGSRICGTVNVTPFLADPPRAGRLHSRRPL